jgi:hypothetical protein
MGASPSTDPSDALQEWLAPVLLNSPAFRAVMREALDEIRQTAAIPNVQEASISGVIERVIYSRLRASGLGSVVITKEDRAANRQTLRGRTDARVGALVVEYKKPGKFSTATTIKDAIDQAEGYIESISAKDKTEMVAFITDGLHVAEARAVDGVVVSRVPYGDLTLDALLRLASAFISLSQTALTADNLVRDFCSQPDGVLFVAARTFLARLSDGMTPKTAMLFAEWKSLFSLSHDDQSQQQRVEDRRRELGRVLNTKITTADREHHALFALHTAYAIVLKLIAWRVVSDTYLHVVAQDFRSLASSNTAALRRACAELESGDIFRRLGINNLLEGDFHSWYADADQWTEEIGDRVREIAVVLSRYEDAATIFTSNNVLDLFRELYEATVPGPVRSSLGEFYTPHWLAEHVIETAIDGQTDWRVIDPCCGSGTFVITAIARVRRETAGMPNAERIQAILSRVAGIDLNPLAVLTARIHYFIHISDLIDPAQGGEITIPVFLGDSASTPARVVIDGVECLSYNLHTKIESRQVITAAIPFRTVENHAHFFAVMRDYEEAIKDLDGERALAILTEGIDEDERVPGVIAAVASLTETLLDLERNKWNGIWGRIITNFLSSASLGRFSAVVGNPPWVDWKNLPSGYRDRLKGLEVVKGIFSGAKRTGGISLDICALISFVSLNNLLADGGRLAFLMPTKLTRQGSYKQWRNLAGQWSIREIHDWADAGKPFDPVSERFSTVVIGARLADQEQVKVVAYKKVKGDRTKSSEWATLEDARTRLTETVSMAHQLMDAETTFTVARSAEEMEKVGLVTGPCAYIGREGTKFYPQELLVFTYDGPGPKPGTVFVKNVQVPGSKYRVPQRRILLETRFLHPMVKSRLVEAFALDQSENLIVAFPYGQKDHRKPISLADLRQQSPELARYFRQNKELFDQQSRYNSRIANTDEGEFYALIRTGPYSFAPHRAVFRASTKWCSTVVSEAEMPWGERKRMLCQDHAVSMSERAHDRSFITEDEAHYICAILNAPIVGQLVTSSSDPRSFDIRTPIYIPLFDPANLRHQRLAALSRQAHADGDSAAIREEIEDIYLGICRERRAAEGA